jgi:hypothetical protein
VKDPNETKQVIEKVIASLAIGQHAA